MSDAWDAAITFVLGIEGGYVNDPMDAGGETKYGISRRSYPHLDIASLTRDAAEKIYWEDYWAPLRCDQLPPALAVAVFDGGVNQGVPAAARMLQLAVRVHADGVIGPQTLNAAHGDSQGLSVPRFLAIRGVRYASTPGFDLYGVGWLGRLFQLQRVCLTVAGPGAAGL